MIGLLVLLFFVFSSLIFNEDNGFNYSKENTSYFFKNKYLL